MSRGRPKTILVNENRGQIAEEWWSRDEPSVWPLWLDDILYGVARLDWYGSRDKQIPLSTLNILRCLAELDEISTESVMGLLNLGKSQSKLYVKACSLALPFINRSLKDERIRRMFYPHTTIVNEKHGLALGYDKQCRSKISGTDCGTD